MLVRLWKPSIFFKPKRFAHIDCPIKYKSLAKKISFHLRVKISGRYNFSLTRKLMPTFVPEVKKHVSVPIVR
jgi:hypothetical protein